MRTTIHRSFGRRRRVEALRPRLVQRRRITARVTPLERVMRRAMAVHLGRTLNAQVGVQLLLSTGVVREIERVHGEQPRLVHVPVHTVTQRMRTLFTQRVKHERVVERLTRGEPAAAIAPRVSFVTRVEQRRAAPRIQLTMVRQQPAVPQAAVRAADTTTTAATANGSDGTHPRFAASAPPLVLPQQELSRLTDHVIRQLDRRVLSWQERTGRV